MRVLVQYRPEERVLVIFPFALSNFPAKGNFKKWLKVALSPIFSSLNSCIVGTEKPIGQTPLTTGFQSNWRECAHYAGIQG
jgi:hypothetical protein